MRTSYFRHNERRDDVSDKAGDDTREFLVVLTSI